MKLIDGVKYISEKEFDVAVEKSMEYLTKIAVDSNNVKGGIMAGMFAATIFGNMKADLFSGKADKGGSE